MRLKITGYIDYDTVPVADRDPKHESGLTAAAWDGIIMQGYGLDDMEDMTVVLEESDD